MASSSLKPCIHCTQVPEISFDLLFLKQVTAIESSRNKFQKLLQALRWAGQNRPHHYITDTSLLHPSSCISLYLLALACEIYDVIASCLDPLMSTLNIHRQSYLACVCALIFTAAMCGRVIRSSHPLT